MLQRFSGTEGRRFAIEALATQRILSGDHRLAEEFCDLSEIESHEPGSVIMAEGDPSNEVCFLLSGSTSVVVHGRVIARRDAGQHVGEMALLDPGQPRSATVSANDEVVLVRTPAATFIDLADCHPSVWRNVARSLAGRLGQRNRLVASSRNAPALFVACSTESLPIAEVIKARLVKTDLRSTSGPTVYSDRQRSRWSLWKLNWPALTSLR